jgi:hypothetical protein
MKDPKELAKAIKNNITNANFRSVKIFNLF